MKVRIVNLVVLAVVAAAVAPADAAADFHGLCSGPADAAALLAVDGGTLTYAARIDCPGTTELAVTELSLRGPGTTTVESAPPTSCSGCPSLLHTATRPADPGYYTVTARFRVTRGTSVASPSRTGRHHHTGTGLVAIGAWQELCDSGASATVDLANESSQPTAPAIVWSGTVDCPGLDIALIDRLRVRNAQTGSSREIRNVRCQPCAAPLTATGTGGTLGPGTYVVEMTFGVQRGGIIFSPLVVSRSWLSLGAGPLLSP